MGAAPVQSSETVATQNDAPREDALRSALANRYCRFVLHYFSDASGDAASVAELSTAFARENDADERRAAVHLHHAALPKLSEVGVVDYDALSKTVYYSGDGHLGHRLRIGESEPEYAVAVR